METATGGAVGVHSGQDTAKSLEFEANRDAETAFAAREEAALVALLKLCGDLPLERKLPDGYRETWLDAIGSAKPKSLGPQGSSAFERSLRRLKPW